MLRPLRSTKKNAAGFTIAELMVSCLSAAAVGLAVFAFINAGMILACKNLALNLTSNQMRGALDRVEQVIQQGTVNPVTINTSGATVASGAAAGVKLDRFIGGPWVVTVSGSGLPSSTTSITMTRSANSLASPPWPSVGDVVNLDGASSLRPRVASVSPTTPPAADGAQHQAVTVTLAAALGTAVTPSSLSILTANLVHQVAFIVMPSGGSKELRYYPNIETTANLNDPTGYVLVTNQIATQAADATPFTLTQVNNETFVNFGLRVRSDAYDNVLRNKESDEYHTFSSVNSVLRPKVNP